MPKRKVGPLTERLRREVQTFVGGHHGRNRPAAEAIGVYPSWLTSYRQGRSHPDLDTYIALMRFAGWQFNGEMSLATTVVDPEIAAALKSETKRREILHFVKLSDKVRTAVLQLHEEKPQQSRAPRRPHCHARHARQRRQCLPWHTAPRPTQGGRAGDSGPLVPVSAGG